MKNKTIIIAVVAVLFLLILLGNWGFVFGFALAIAVCWFFGFEKVKEFALAVWEGCQNLWGSVSENLGDKEETIDAVISDSVVIPYTSSENKFQIMVTAGGKCYMLKPTESGVLPSCLTKGKPVQIKTKFVRQGLKTVKEVSLIADGQVFETL